MARGRWWKLVGNEARDEDYRMCPRCWRDNVFVERLWRSVKYEEVYLYAYDCVNDAKRGLEKYFKLYNQDRPHTALDDQTPDESYFGNLPALPKAA